MDEWKWSLLYNKGHLLNCFSSNWYKSYWSYLVSIEVKESEDRFVWSGPDTDVQSSVGRSVDDVEQNARLGNRVLGEVNGNLSEKKNSKHFIKITSID